MKLIKLTQNKFAKVDDEDFDWLNHFTWYAQTNDGNNFYPRRTTGHNMHELMHRQILGATKGDIVDHINGNGLDNQKINLRFVTHTQNMWNTNKTKCFYWDKSRNLWAVEITANHNRYRLGRFSNKEYAESIARRAKKIRNNGIEPKLVNVTTVSI